MGTRVGGFAVRDHGGSGPTALLLHGSGHNLEAWEPFVARVRDRLRLVAVDLRGHGRTMLESSDAEQYWRDIGPLVAGLGLRRPVLVGHSLGGYAATAFAASGGACAAVVAVDGFVPDPRERVEQETALRDQAEWERSLWEAFRYGWRASEAELAEHLRSRPDPLGLYQGVDPAAVTALLRRSFVPDGAGGWLRRPTMDEIRRLSRAPEGEIYPSVEVYDRVTVPMLLVMASQGFYWTRYEQMARVAAAGGNRRLVTVEGGHNLVMQQPERLAEVVVDFVSSLPALVSED